LIVVAIAVVIVVGGVGLSFATGGWGGPSGSTGATGTTGAALINVTGSPLAGVSAAQALSAIVSNGEPPAGIVDSLVVPSGAKVTGHENVADGDGPFDSSVFLASAASPSQVVSFYRVEMKHQGWGLLPGGVSVSGSATTLYFEQAGKDGYYWQVAVTVTSESPTLAPPLAGGDQTAPTSGLELELVQVEDAD
jgi:hypothetical protein